MTKKTGIKPKVLEQIVVLAREHGILRLVLFGSRARGDFKRASDIDLAVSGGNVSLFQLDINDKTDTLLTFDVVDLNDKINDALRNEIIRDGILLYEKV